MPYRYELTWIPRLKKWRKRYLGKTYYLKTPCLGKKDRPGYLAALEEWRRLKLHLDGLATSPYTATGTLIPADTVASVPMDVPAQDAKPKDASVEAMAEDWLSRRQKEAERGNLSLKAWAEDKAKLKVFRDYLKTFDVATIDQIDAAVLDGYRDAQWKLIEGKKGISRSTLKKRLDVLCKWIRWLLDESYLKTAPKDLSTYPKVRIDRPKPKFFSLEEIKQLIELAPSRTRLYIALALNCGYTQIDIATLEFEMIDWQTGIITRERHKTGMPQFSKLWPSTLELLRKHRTPFRTGPVLLTQDGLTLYGEEINRKGKVVHRDPIRLAFDRLRRRAKLKDSTLSFKHLRKTAANEVEQMAPHLTSAFLGHVEAGTKRYYVTRHFEELFSINDGLEGLYGLGEVEQVPTVVGQ